ncbi:unnamed protein product, partial [Eretmochelys imbricata]
WRAAPSPRSPSASSRRPGPTPLTWSSCRPGPTSRRRCPPPRPCPAASSPTPRPPTRSHFRRSEPFLSHLLGYAYSSFRVGPVTLEPTDDGMAGVATVLFQLPGGPQAPNRACLASALVTLRHNLQDYCSGSHGAGGARKGLRSP